MTEYKPEIYNSLSPYLIVENASKLIDFLTVLFEAKILRRFDHDNGKIAHVELKLDDTVIMVSDSTESYVANKSMLHIYVPDVSKTFDKVIENG
jgi:PhnB protein